MIKQPEGLKRLEQLAEKAKHEKIDLFMELGQALGYKSKSKEESCYQEKKAR